jgi:hypothetical protein
MTAKELLIQETENLPPELLTEASGGKLRNTQECLIRFGFRNAGEINPVCHASRDNPYFWFCSSIKSSKLENCPCSKSSSPCWIPFKASKKS